MYSQETLTVVFINQALLSFLKQIHPKSRTISVRFLKSYAMQRVPNSLPLDITVFSYLLVSSSLLTRLQNVISPISDHFIVTVHSHFQTTKESTCTRLRILNGGILQLLLIFKRLYSHRFALWSLKHNGERGKVIEKYIESNAIT